MNAACYDVRDMPRRKAAGRKKKTAARKQPAVKPVYLRFRQRRKPTEKLADILTGYFGTVTFLLLNLVFFVAWVVWNSGFVSGLQPFDPYPFGMLTMLVSLEAIALSVIVLISQNRAAKRDEAREEIDFQVDLQSEKQIASMMRSLDKILHHLKISHHEDGPNLKALDVDKLERRVIAEIDTD